MFWPPSTYKIYFKNYSVMVYNSIMSKKNLHTLKYFIKNVNHNLTMEGYPKLSISLKNANSAKCNKGSAIKQMPIYEFITYINLYTIINVHIYVKNIYQ